MPTVTGFEYINDYDDERNRAICIIIDRGGPDEDDYPTFVIRFSDGVERECLHEDLRPWYAVSDQS